MKIATQIHHKFLLAVFKIRRFVGRWLGVRRLDYKKHDVFIRTHTIREYETRARSVEKEPKTVTWIEKHGGQNAVLYDIGANIGAYTLIAAVRGTQVIAFEPAHQNIYKLQENILFNKLSDRVTVAPFILGGVDEVVRFIPKDITFGASRSFSAQKSDGNLRGQSFLAMRLDTCIKTFSLPKPTMVKIDVDGSEVEVLRGGEAMFKNTDLRNVLVEAGKENVESVKKLLSDWSFQLVDKEYMDENTMNYIFERS